MFFVKGKALLSGLKKKALTQFEQEMLDLIDDGTFQVGFRVLRFFIKTKKLEDIGFLEQILWAGDKLSFYGELANILLVPAEGKTLIQARIELAFKLR